VSLLIDINQSKQSHYHLHVGDLCRNCLKPVERDPSFPKILVHVWNGGFKWCDMKDDDNQNVAELIPYGEVVSNA